ncbi:hypothetical protein NDU88_004190, partial [Pleurodeles waltl]
SWRHCCALSVIHVVVNLDHLVGEKGPRYLALDPARQSRHFSEDSRAGGVHAGCGEEVVEACQKPGPIFTAHEGAPNVT